MTNKSTKYAFSLTERNRLKISKNGEPDFNNMVNRYFIFNNLKIESRLLRCN